MKKKKFKSNSSKWKIIDTIVFIVFIINVFTILMRPELNIISNMSLPFLLCLLFIVCFSNFPLVLIYFAIKTAIKKNERKNVIFEAVNDIEYYRDNLGEISPALISVMMDLDIENDKDICAMLLYYKAKDIISFDENKKIIINNKSLLKESDLAFCKWLESKNVYYLAEWKKLVIEEAGREGYLKRKEVNSFKGCAVPIFINIFLMIIIGLLFVSIFNIESLNHIETVLGAIPDNITIQEQIKLIFTDAPTVFFITKIIILVLCCLVLFFNPIVSIVYFISHNLSVKRVKRTKLGNELTEKIYAMKNFIHDFSSLSEATKKHLMLWDYFLIYAVVLEENEKIVKEISNYWNIDLHDFMISKV